MGYLKDKRFYLSGPIEYASGADWFNEPTQVLKNEFEINLFNPVKDKKQQWVSKLHKYKEKKNFKGVRRIAKKFVKKDLGLTNRSDALIAFLPSKVPTVGTCHEIIKTNEEKKPTLLVGDNGIENIPAWYFGFIPLRYMFNDWDHLYEYLREVNEGKHKKDDRWWFVYEVI